MTSNPFSLTASPSSMSGLCAGVRRFLSQNLNDELAVTAQDYTPGDAAVVLHTVGKRIGPGSLLSWHEATLYVVSVSTTSNTVEVISGYDGGPDVAIPAGTVLRVNPRWTDFTLFNTLSSVIGSMSSPSNNLYGLAKEYKTGMALNFFYPVDPTIAARMLRVLQVRERTNASTDWARISEYEVSQVPGNQHLRIFTYAIEYEIQYAVKIQKPTSFADDAITVCGMADTMLDIPVLGAAAALMMGQEARRVHQRAQGDPRRSEDVPITGAANSASQLQRLFNQRVDEEYAALIAQSSLAV